MERKEPPRHALIFGEVGARLLELNERDKAYEMFVLAGRFALSKVAPLIVEPVKEKI